MLFQKEQVAIDTVKSALAILEQHLTENTYLVSHYITLADIIAWCNLVVGFKQVQSPFFALATSNSPKTAPKH